MLSARFFTFVAITVTFSGIVVLVACAPGKDREETRITRTNPSPRAAGAGGGGGGGGEVAATMNLSEHHNEADFVLASAVTANNTKQTEEIDVYSAQELSVDTMKDFEKNNVSFTGALIKSNQNFFTDSVSTDEALKKAKEIVLTGDAAQVIRNQEFSKLVRTGTVHIITKTKTEGASVERTKTFKIIVALKTAQSKLENIEFEGALGSDGSGSGNKEVGSVVYSAQLKCMSAQTCAVASVTLQKEEQGVHAQTVLVRRLLNLNVDVATAKTENLASASENFKKVLSALNDWKQGKRSELIARVRFESFTVPFGVSTLAVSIDGGRAQALPVTARATTGERAISNPPVSQNIATDLNADSKFAEKRVTLLGVLARAFNDDELDLDYLVTLGDQSVLGKLIESARLVKNDGKGTFALEIKTIGAAADEAIKLALRPLTEAEINAQQERLARLAQGRSAALQAAQQQSATGAEGVQARDGRRADIRRRQDTHLR